MEAREAHSTQPPGGRYILPPSKLSPEDILFCIDVDPECLIEMKNTSVTGRPFTRLECIKQGILLFLHAKLAVNQDHRFAYCALGKSPFWLKKEFSSEVDSAIAAFRGITVDSSAGHADLTHLFKVANHEAKKSRAQNRILRVILLYCRSSVAPHHQWPVSQKLFTFDVVYLHDKPGPDNCPQKVYDGLVDALEQRCGQDDIDIPKSLTKKPPVVDLTPSDQECVPVSSQ
uniref:BRISC and BRCA1-A complex member n=1 Tax=Tanacetum cinerariifolium TaxID=118510 RepID=A0A6L2N7G3_TANCI|nr:BRISC and BRCA1-A complex member [Tanacetum cinerariifolium]